MKNGKKNFKNIVLFVSAFFIFMSCGAPRAVRKTRKVRDISLAKVQVKRALTIGVRKDFPPFVRLDQATGELEGFDIETAKLVCQQMNLKADFKIINWKEKEELLKSEKIDCIWSGFPPSLADNTDILITKPYVKTCYVIAVPEDSILKELKDLTNKNIGIYEDFFNTDISQNIAKKNSDIFKTFYYEDLRDCISDFEHRNLDGFIGDFLLINDLINAENKPYKILEEALNPESYVIGFRKQDIVLAKRVQDILEYLEYHDKIKPIAEKWFGSDITVIGK